MTRAFAIITGCLLLISGCKKTPLPEPEAENPDFFLDCKLNQQPVLLEAGNDNYFMNTSYYHDSGDVYVFKGNLSQTCSGNCGYGVTVLINDLKRSVAGSPIDVNSALHKGTYSYNDNVIASDSYSVLLKPLENQNANNTYAWVILSNGDKDSIPMTYSLNKQFKAGVTYTVTLYVECNFGGGTNHTRVYKIGGTQGNIQATSTSQTDLAFKFTCDIPVVFGNQYVWDFGDGSTSTEWAPSHTYSPSSSSENYYPKLTITTAANEIIVLHYQVPGNLGLLCMVANFNSVVTPIQKTTVFSRVTVIITDPSGKSYTTKNFQQPISSSFVVDEISDYAVNANGDPTKMLKVHLNCVLKNGSDVMVLSEGKASIGVAYK